MTPVTWSVFRPVILVPTYMLDWPEEKYTAIIRHEQAHTVRRDWLWQTFAECLTAVLWFHPLVWLAAARLRFEAEHSADDLVLAGGTGASSYAQQLLEVTRRLQRDILLTNYTDDARSAKIEGPWFCPLSLTRRAKPRKSESQSP
jgi:beta-lactamase regulating signal transducer with metallopeptidase domain